MRLKHTGIVLLSVTVLNLMVSTVHNASANSLEDNSIQVVHTNQSPKNKKGHKQMSKKHAPKKHAKGKSKKKKVKKHVKSKKKRIKKKVVKKTKPKKKKVVKKKTMKKPTLFGASLMRSSSTPKPIFYESTPAPVDNTPKEIGHYSEVFYTTGTETNTIELPEKYKELLKNIAKDNLKGTNSTRDEKKLSDYLNKNPNLVQKSYHFVANPNDEKRYVNLYDLSSRDRQDINNFTLNLLNHIRKQFNQTLISSAPLMDRFTDEIAQGYDKDKWNTLYKGHDMKVVNGVAKKWKLPYDKTNQSQYYEATSIWKGAITKKILSHIRLSELKAYIFFNVGTMFLEDGGKEHWGHSCQLAGLWEWKSKYVFGSTIADKETNMHIEIVPDAMMNKSLRTQMRKSHY